MKILMLRSKMGSNDGFTTKLYEAGETYDVSDALAESFLAEKLAETVVEAKAEPAAPENKAVAKAPKNKAAPKAGEPEPYVEGELYTDADGLVYVGSIPEGHTEVALLPIDQLGDDERAELVTEGKLTSDGKAVEHKPVEAKAA